MSDGSLETLTERERTCLAHLSQARELGISFSKYCRERDLKFRKRVGSTHSGWRRRAGG
jgi:hypothetical protein